MQFYEYGCIFYFDLYIYFYVDVIRDRAYPLQQHYAEINIYPVKFVILKRRAPSLSVRADSPYRGCSTLILMIRPKVRAAWQTWHVSNILRDK